MEIKIIQGLIADNKVREALEELKNEHFRTEDSHTFLMLQSRYNEIEQKKIRGILSHQDENIDSSKLKNDLLSFISTFEDTQKPIKDISKLEDTQTLINNITPIRFDNLFFNNYTLDELELFLHEFEMNLAPEIDVSNWIVFEYEDMLIDEMETNSDKLTKTRLRNTLGIFGAYKTDLVEMIKILLNNHLYYELNKPKQAIVLRSILEQFSKKNYEIFEKTKGKGFSTEYLISMLKNYSKKPSLNNTNFLNENSLTDSVKIAIFNKKYSDDYSISLTKEEFEELKRNLDNYGENYFNTRLFIGENAMEARRLSEKLIFERAIPKSIFIFYYKLKDNRITKEEFNLYINFDNMYIGLD